MKRHRGILTSLALGALALATCLSGAYVYFTRLPDPETADRRGLLRWLVTRDLQHEPLGRQQLLVRRFEDELRGAIDLTQATARLNDRQRELMAANVDLLAQLWFDAQVDRYFEQPQAQRPNFLDRQLAELRTSGVVEQLGRFASGATHEAIDATPAAGQQPSALTAVLQRVQHWIEQAEPARRQQMEEFVAAVQMKLLAEQMRRWLMPPEGLRTSAADPATVH